MWRTLFQLGGSEGIRPRAPQHDVRRETALLHDDDQDGDGEGALLLDGDDDDDSIYLATCEKISSIPKYGHYHASRRHGWENYASSEDSDPP